MIKNFQFGNRSPKMRMVIRILRQVKSRDEFKFKPQVQQLLETRLEIWNLFQDGFLFYIHSFHSLKISLLLLSLLLTIHRNVRWEICQEPGIELLLCVSVPCIWAKVPTQQRRVSNTVVIRIVVVPSWFWNERHKGRGRFLVSSPLKSNTYGGLGMFGCGILSVESSVMAAPTTLTSFVSVLQRPPLSTS